MLIGGAAELQNLGGDTITDFQRGQDKIELRDLFSDFALDHGGDPAAEGHLVLTQSGADTVVQFDPDGPGGGAAFALATVTGVRPTSTDFVH